MSWELGTIHASFASLHPLQSNMGWNISCLLRWYSPKTRRAVGDRPAAPGPLWHLGCGAWRMDLSRQPGRGCSEKTLIAVIRGVNPWKSPRKPGILGFSRFFTLSRSWPKSWQLGSEMLQGLEPLRCSLFLFPIPRSTGCKRKITSTAFPMLSCPARNHWILQDIRNWWWT